MTPIRRRSLTGSGWRVLRALAWLPLLAACAVGQDHRRPEVTVPSGFRGEAPVAAVDPPIAAWWQAFGSEALDRLVEQAMADNHDLKAAASRIDQARAIAAQAGAIRQPALSFNGGWSRGADVDESARSQVGGRLVLTQRIDWWGGDRQAHHAALARIDVSVEARQTLRLALQADVVQAYLAWLSARDRLAVAQGTLDSVLALTRLVDVQHREGRVSGLELARQRSLLASTRSSLSPLQQEAEQALHALAVLLGRAPQGFAPPASPLSALRLPAVNPGVPADLLRRRPELRQLEHELVAIQADVNTIRAAMLPSLQIGAEIGSFAGAIGHLLRPASLLHNLLAGIAAPVLDGGRLRARDEQAVARQTELVHQYRQALLVALREVDDALSAMRWLGEQAQHQAEALGQAREALRLGQVRYRAGSVDHATVLDAQRVLLATLLADEAVRLARYQAAVRLIKALGTGA